MATATAPAAKKAPSLAVQLGILGVLTAAAIGIGWFSGGYLRGEILAAAATEGTAEIPPHANADDGHGDGGAGGDIAQTRSTPMIVDLPAVTTNLAAPGDTWVRAEMSIHFNTAPPPGMVERIGDDVLAYFRTVKLHQIEGPSGYLHLKADIKERADMISGGLVQAVLIRTLLFE